MQLDSSMISRSPKTQYVRNQEQKWPILSSAADPWHFGTDPDADPRNPYFWLTDPNADPKGPKHTDPTDRDTEQLYISIILQR